MFSTNTPKRIFSVWSLVLVMQNMDNAYGGDKRRNPTKQSIEEYAAKQSIHCLRLIIAKLAQLKYRGIGGK